MFYQSINVLYLPWGSLTVLPLRLAEYGYSTTSVLNRPRKREALHAGSSGVPREPADVVRAHPPARAGARGPDRGAWPAFPRADPQWGARLEVGQHDPRQLDVAPAGDRDAAEFVGDADRAPVGGRHPVCPADGGADDEGDPGAPSRHRTDHPLAELD